MDIISGGIVAPQGYRTAGVYCGIKRKRNDLCLIVSEVEAAAAGVFTTNVVKAPCVLSNQTHLQDGRARAIVVNSGNANACNGEQGWTDAVAMVGHAAAALGLPPRRVLSASTGVIGTKLPLEKIIAGIEAAVPRLHGDTCDDAAQAIMTTDTFLKQVAVVTASILHGQPRSAGARLNSKAMSSRPSPTLPIDRQLSALGRRSAVESQ